MYYIVDDDLNVIDGIEDIDEYYATLDENNRKLDVAKRLAREIKNNLDLQHEYHRKTGELDDCTYYQELVNNYYYKMYACELLD